MNGRPNGGPPRAAWLLGGAVALVLLFGGAPQADAAFTFTAVLTNDQENPTATPLTTSNGAPRPISHGVATFILNEAMTSLSFTATIHNIDLTGSQTPDDSNDNLVAAHIHAGPNVTPTSNGPVVWGFFGTPFNENDPNDLVITPFASGVGGTISGKWDAGEGNNTTLAAQIDNLFGGRAYINFHTTQFPGGEIRGAIKLVPEPTSLAVWLVAGVGLVAVGRRARRRSGHVR